MDSNHRYRIRNNPFWLPPFGPIIRLPQQKPALSCRGPMVRIHLPPAESPSLVPPQIRTIESGVDDPDQQFYENFVCGAVRNYTGYCNPEVDKLIDQQSAEANREKRKQLVWQIERKLAEEQARPIIFYPRGGTCSQPYVKGLVTMVNSIYNGYRMEDVWLDK